MIHQFFTTEYLFWIVAFSFYIIDNVKLVPKNHLIVREKLTAGCAPLISFSRYELTGKEIKVPNLFLPFTMIFMLRCAPQTNLNKKETLRASRRLKIMRVQMLPLKAISAISFISLLAGPILTFYFGLVFALTYLIPIHVTLLIFSASLLITRRAKLNLSKEKAILLFVESVLVPAYLSNIVRRVSFKQNFSVDGYAFAINHAVLSDLEEIKYQIGMKLDSLIAEHEDEQTSHMLYSSYKENLRV